MQGIYERFGWLARPQLLAVFVVASLLVGAFGASMRQGQPSLMLADTPVKRVKGAEMAVPPPPVPPDCSIVPCIALTFDDGPDPRITPQILDILARNQVPATFFLVGREVSGREPIVRRIHAEGHEIGNHSWSHADFTKLSPVAIREEIASTQAAIIAAGVPAPRTFRPPYGAVNATVRAHVALPIVRWDIDTQDWVTRDVGQITERLILDAHPGGIILMHDKFDESAQSLDATLQALKTQYHFVTASYLLGLSAGDQGQYFGRQP